MSCVVAWVMLGVATVAIVILVILLSESVLWIADLKTERARELEALRRAIDGLAADAEATRDEALP